MSWRNSLFNKKLSSDGFKSILFGNERYHSGANYWSWVCMCVCILGNEKRVTTTNYHLPFPSYASILKCSTRICLLIIFLLVYYKLPNRTQRKTGFHHYFRCYSYRRCDFGRWEIFFRHMLSWNCSQQQVKLVSLTTFNLVLIYLGLLP